MTSIALHATVRWKVEMRKGVAIHERFDRGNAIVRGSDRAFGLILGTALTIIGLWPLWDAGTPRAWSLAPAAILIVLGLVRPAVLSPLNRAWTRLGLAMHRVISPIVLGFIFYTTVTPIGLLMRALGKDTLGLRLSPSQPSYWIRREPPGPLPATMRRQF